MFIDFNGPAVPKEAYRYRDAGFLTKVLVTAVGLSAALSIITLIAAWIEYDLLARMAGNGGAAEGAIWAEMAVSNSRFDVLVTLQSAVGRAGFVLFVLWLYRLNSNVHALGARNMGFTPWWAIASYLIPIVNLYKPYQGMQELWKTNASVRDWQTVPGSPLAGMWWALFLLSEFVAQLTFVLGQSGEDVDGYMETIAWEAGWDAINIPYAIAAVLLFRGLYRLQLNQASGAA